MRRIRQTADGGLPMLRQKTPDAPGEILPEINIAPTPFSLNQSSAMCLPLVSDDQRLIWVLSNHVDLQPNGAAELGKAFDRFPYLTQKQTAALAKRCSLHPDQVRVWFMAQRLRYGISWDYKDILKVQSKFKSNQDKDDDTRENKTRKREVNKSGGKTARGEVWGDRKIKPEQPMQKEKERKDEEDKNKTQKNRKCTTVTGKMEEKRMTRGDGDGFVVERVEEEVKRETQKSGMFDTTICARMKQETNKRSLSVLEWTPCKSFDEAHFTERQTEPAKRGDVAKTGEEELHAESTNPNDTVSDDGRLKELMAVNDNPTTDRDAVDRCTLPTRIRSHAKTQTQTAKLRVAFLHCQYPDNDDYINLSKLIGLPRYLLVQWFADTRYSLKRGKPSWMSEEQHSQARANVRCRQYMMAMGKSQPSKRDKKRTWKMKLGVSGSCGKDEGVQGPSESK